MSRPVIKVKAGDDKTVRVAVRNADGSARDLTGETIEFRAAVSLGAADATIAKVDGDGILVADATLGLVDVVFVPEDTLDAPTFLLWEIRVTATSGAVITLDWGDDASDPWTFGLIKVERPMLLAG